MNKFLKISVFSFLLTPILVQASFVQNVEKVFQDPVTLFFVIVIVCTTIFFQFIK
jgi:hypothetical protein